MHTPSADYPHHECGVCGQGVRTIRTSGEDYSRQYVHKLLGQATDVEQLGESLRVTSSL